MALYGTHTSYNDHSQGLYSIYDIRAGVHPQLWKISTVKYSDIICISKFKNLYMQFNKWHSELL